ncbi:MAG: DUF1501 domain-containing protein [Pedosphaera sp.]|nr:DUF1501 domain-containing protein [Pedosphaera sp.]
MLKIFGNFNGRDCDGISRRNFLQVGSLGAAGLTLPGLLQARALAATQGRQVKNKSVIWVWLSGGPTHVETFDPKMDAPSEYRSLTGECATPIPGVTVGGTFPEIGKVADKMALVRSFAHGNSSHGTATTWVMTGYEDRENMKPSLGSIIAKASGTTNPRTGMPTYVRMGAIRSDGPGWLGTQFQALDPSGQARKNMELEMDSSRMENRRGLLSGLDTISRTVDRSGQMEGLDGFEQQAFNLVLGDAKGAFDINKESAKTRERYGKGLGEQLLLARRLCAAGCGFVSINYGGWDMHGSLVRSITSRAPQMDRGLSALISDLHESGQSEDTLVVITGEFGRTPRVNKSAGRDHWGRLCTLALAGGGLRMGQVIGRSSRNVEVPEEGPVHPQDVMATILHMYGLDPKLQFTNPQGRPMYMIEQGRLIKDLV